MIPVELKTEYSAGAGWQIKALLKKEVNCAEFILKKDCFLRVMEGKKPEPNMLIGYEPWIQFAPKEWDDMIGEIFTEMVSLWNEKQLNAGADMIQHKT